MDELEWGREVHPAVFGPASKKRVVIVSCMAAINGIDRSYPVMGIANMP
jgi:hypothetical protein